ncbi:hypothetical protein [Rubellimicrobium aerolatum]|uniref:Flagellar FliJ protein n=1 Tax=Rubellimicrobium aerolatum TaxID=490979 RepID=A0ABW0S9W1_9RHOB|nr:hypothetical protein [Rubellimicrobium aerolatum]MBP1805074.1 hypothetical protein [Rubellimicrobium aerolatum]
MTAKDLTALAGVAAMACDAAEARLARLRQEETELRRQIGALDSARRARAAEALATDVALRAGADLRWEGWIEGRSAALGAELARLRARIEVARDDLARAFGRRTAIETLAEDVRRDRAARRLRFEERNS